MNIGLLQNRLTEPYTKGSTTEVVNVFSENVNFIRANTVPGNKSYTDVVMPRNTKNGITKKMIFFGGGDSIIRGIRVRNFNQQVMLSSKHFLVVIVKKCYIILSQH